MSSKSGQASRRDEARARAAERARQAQRKRRVTWISGLAVAGLVVLGLAGWAISNGNGGEPERPAGSDTVSQEESVLAFFQCLRDNGLDVDDPDPDGGGGIALGGGDSQIDFADPAVQAILETCRGETGGGPMQVGDGPGTAQTDSLFNFVACLQDHGIDFPDPDPDGTLIMPEDLDPQSAEFQAARDACVEHLDGGGVRIQGPGDGPRGAFNR